eukprot:gene799-2540_t
MDSGSAPTPAPCPFVECELFTHRLAVPRALWPPTSPPAPQGGWAPPARTKAGGAGMAMQGRLRANRACPLSPPLAAPLQRCSAAALPRSQPVPTPALPGRRCYCRLGPDGPVAAHALPGTRSAPLAVLAWRPPAAAAVVTTASMRPAPLVGATVPPAHFAAYVSLCGLRPTVPAPAPAPAAPPGHIPLLSSLGHPQFNSAACARGTAPSYQHNQPAPSPQPKPSAPRLPGPYDRIHGVPAPTPGPAGHQPPAVQPSAGSRYAPVPSPMSWAGSPHGQPSSPAYYSHSPHAIAPAWPPGALADQAIPSEFPTQPDAQSTLSMPRPLVPPNALSGPPAGTGPLAAAGLGPGPKSMIRWPNNATPLETRRIPKAPGVAELRRQAKEQGDVITQLGIQAKAERQAKASLQKALDAKTAECTAAQLKLAQADHAKRDAQQAQDALREQMEQLRAEVSELRPRASPDTTAASQSQCPRCSPGACLPAPGTSPPETPRPALGQALQGGSPSPPWTGNPPSGPPEVWAEMAGLVLQLNDLCEKGRRASTPLVSHCGYPAPSLPVGSAMGAQDGHEFQSISEPQGVPAEPDMTVSAAGSAATRRPTQPTQAPSTSPPDTSSPGDPKPQESQDPASLASPKKLTIPPPGPWRTSYPGQPIAGLPKPEPASLAEHRPAGNPLKQATRPPPATMPRRSPLAPKGRHSFDNPSDGRNSTDDDDDGAEDDSSSSGSSGTGSSSSSSRSRDGSSNCS